MSCLFNGIIKIVGITLIFGSLFLNFIYTFIPSFRDSPFGKSIFINHDTQPLSSPDYDEYQRLINDLRFEFANQTIYAVDSSATLNSDLFQNAERMLYPNQIILDFISSPSIDSRDQYPIKSLMQADLVILSKPHQFHLKPEDQEIVSVIYKVFDERWDISKDFIKTDFEYHFSPNISTFIYQRKTPTDLSDAVKTFHKIQEFIEPNPPGGQDDWVRLSYVTDEHAYFEQDNIEQTNYLRLMLSNEFGDANFIYIGDRPKTGLLSANITFEPGCEDVTIVIQGFSSQGNLTYLNFDNIDQSIEISYSIEADDYFIFNIQPNSSRYCVIEFSELRFLDRQD